MEQMHRCLMSVTVLFCSCCWGKKTSQIGNCILCSVGIAHIVQVNQIQNIHFETDMNGEIDMKWFFFFQTGIRSKFGKKYFA